MEYEEFKKELTRRLKEEYGENTEVGIHTVKRNNGQSYDGIYIIMKETGQTAAPVIRIDGLYGEYRNGSMDIQECAEEIGRKCKEYEATGDIVEFTSHLTEWDAIKDRIYPVLLSTDKNREMLEGLVSTTMLDLSVAYTIRIDGIKGENIGSIRISRAMLQYYNIEGSQLHAQAMENLAKDGYSFTDMQSLIRGKLRTEENAAENTTDCDMYNEEFEMEDMRAKMYVLTNKIKSYGAAGILNKKLVREFAKGHNFFILPSSIHETIFVLADNIADREIFDNMVEDVNKTQVITEEQLSDHCYYYDGQADEIRICA
ncbi:MAG: DUF5688 family protein [Butyrivibrio sp.]|nr:DUF5688 family protein [Butyrivibrio sp.]